MRVGPLSWAGRAAGACAVSATAGGGVVVRPLLQAHDSASANVTNSNRRVLNA